MHGCMAVQNSLAQLLLMPGRCHPPALSHSRPPLPPHGHSIMQMCSFQHLCLLLRLVHYSPHTIRAMLWPCHVAQPLLCNLSRSHHSHSRPPLLPHGHSIMQMCFFQHLCMLLRLVHHWPHTIRAMLWPCHVAQPLLCSLSRSRPAIRALRIMRCLLASTGADRQ